VAYFGDLIHPFRQGNLVGFPFVDPVPYQRFAVGGGRVPGDTGNDQIPILYVAGVGAHFEN
jgi:hypothetical protein